MTRHFWVLVHRYAGLYIALFLTIAGVTGSILAFLREVTDWVNPPPVIAAAGRPLLDALVLRERALAAVPRGRINYLDLHLETDRAVQFYLEPRVDPATEQPYMLDTQTISLDPYSGAELKRAPAPASPEAYPFWPITRDNVMNFIYSLHYSLTLPGSLGVWLFGIAALVWTLDCFVGFYVTLPVRVGSPEGEMQAGGLRKTWWRKWKPAWLVKVSGSAYRINFDLHRAGGLWTWAMLFVFAWSSVAFNLGEQVYYPVMKALFDMRDPIANVPKLSKSRDEPHTTWANALANGRKLMAEQASIHGLTVEHEQALYFDGEHALFSYAARTDRDIADRRGQTTVFFKDDGGQFVDLMIPSGQSAGVTVTGWLVALHMAAVWGMPMKIFVCLMGIVIAMLSITGIYLWLKKRRAFAVSKQRLDKTDASVVT